MSLLEGEMSSWLTTALDTLLSTRPRSRWKVFLSVSHILTAAVPPEFPTTLSFVTSLFLFALHKLRIFCTEPHRFQYAGRVTTCCFDKTGTLTSSKYTVDSVVTEVPVKDEEVNGPGVSAKDSKQMKGTPSMGSELHADFVLGACHSLLLKRGKKQQSKSSTQGLAKKLLQQSRQIPGLIGRMLQPGEDSEPVDECASEIIGDPAEQAAFEYAGWKFDEGAPAGAGASSTSGWLPTVVQEQAEDSAAGPSTNRLKILERFPFQSELQRMSVVAAKMPVTTSKSRAGAGQSPPFVYAFVKGSPEMLRSRICFKNSSEASAYEREATRLTHHGLRVLALAWKDMSAEVKKNPKVANLLVEKNKPNGSNVDSLFERADVEDSNLQFAGFLALRSNLKPHTKKTIRELQNCDHKCVMITGDALATACHVAQECGMVPQDADFVTPIYPSNSADHVDQTTTVDGNKQANAVESKSLKVRWRRLEGGSAAGKIDSSSADGESLDEKRVLKNLKAGSMALCVSFADLGRFRTLHASSTGTFNFSSWRRKVFPHVSVFARATPDCKKALLDDFSASGEITLMIGDGLNDVGALKRAHVGISLLSTSTEKGEFFPRSRSKKVPAGSKKGKSQPPASSPSASEADDAGDMNPLGIAAEDFLPIDEQDLMAGGGAGSSSSNKPGGSATAQLGEASIASPFTYRGETIQCVTKLLQAGRGACCVTLQMYQIMGVNSVVLACGLSLVTLDGTRTSEAQALLESLFISSLFFLISRSSVGPLTRQRPVANLSHPASWASMGLQTVCHLSCIFWALAEVDAYNSANSTLRKAAAVENAEIVPEQVSSPSSQLFNFPKLRTAYGIPVNAEFVPTLRGTVLFFCIQVNQLANFLANYSGRPFLVAFTENKPLRNTWVLYLFVLLLLIFEVLPGVDWLLGLYPIPDEDLRHRVAGILAVDLAGSVGGAWTIKAMLCKRFR
ncbi:unnamed protein product [Amoebophrya sp. A120]|nr:unnamed protein product [Amoebophrya sp. A120]|eukprot:GSA120T00003108001.1